MALRLNNRGSALIVCLILSLLVISSIAIYGGYNFMRSREDVSSLSRRQALNCADSGLNNAIQWLRLPASSTDPSLFGPPNSITLQIPCTNGRAETVLSVNASNPHYIVAHSTGYYYLESGATEDPASVPPNRKAQLAAVRSTILFMSVTKFFVAVNNTLEIAAETDLTGASIYSDKLIFDAGAPIKVGHAYYNLEFKNDTDGTDIANVQFTELPGVPEKLNIPLKLPTVDGTTRQLYFNRSQIAPPSSYLAPLPPAPPAPPPLFSHTFVGSVSEPSNGSHVYYVEGDVDIGTSGMASQALSVNGVYTIYAKGDVRIHNNIQLFGPDAWLGLVAEGTIHVASDAPDVLILNGNFVANGGLQADPATRPVTMGDPCKITFTGGIVGWTAPDIATVWTPSTSCERKYIYPTVTSHPASKSPKLYLPSITNMLDYTIVQGRYR